MSSQRTQRKAQMDHGWQHHSVSCFCLLGEICAGEPLQQGHPLKTMDKRTWMGTLSIPTCACLSKVIRRRRQANQELVFGTRIESVTHAIAQERKCQHEDCQHNTRQNCLPGV